MAQPPPYDSLANAPKEIKTATTIALLCAATSRLIGILSTTTIIALLPTWWPGLLAIQPLPVALLVLSVGSFILARMGFRNRERIAGRRFVQARSSSLIAAIIGLVMGIIPGVLSLLLYTRLGKIMVKRRPDDPPTIYLLPQPSEGIFLGRYLGWGVAYLLVLYVGYTQLPQGLADISDWLSPTLGVHFNTLMVAAYLVLTNPLTYPPLLQLWVTAGFLGGIIAGGRIGRGFFVGLAVFLSTLGAMGLAALAIARGFSFATLFQIPPPPPGFSLTGIASGPIAKDLIPLFLTAGSPTDTTFQQSLALILIRNAGLVFATVTISGRVACLVWQGGVILAKQAVKIGRRATTRSQDRSKGPSGKIVKVGMLLLALAFLIPLHHTDTIGNISEAPFAGPYQQNLDVGLDMLGAPNSSLRLTNLDLSGKGLALNSNYDNANFSMFLINNNYTQAFGNGPQSFLLRLFSEPALITYFTGNLATSMPKADAIASQFSQALGVSFTFDLAFPTGQGIIMIYSPTPQLSNGEALKRTLALLPAASFSSLINTTRTDNQKYAAMLGFLPPFNGISLRAFSFMMTVQWPRMFFKAGPHTLSLKTFFGFQNSITADPNANVSLVTLNLQKGTVLYSSLAPNPLWINYTSTYVYNATLASRPDITANFTYPFAPKVVVQKTVSPSGGTVGTSRTVTLTVQNLDSVAVDNLNVTDSETSSAYRSTIELSSGGNQRIQLANFTSGDSKSLRYSATPRSSGKYVLSAANAEFIWTAPNGTRIRYSVSTDEVVLSSFSGPATQFSNSFNDLQPYSFLLLIPLLLAPVSETLRLVARRRRKKPAPSSLPPTSPAPPQTGPALGSKPSSATETKEVKQETPPDKS